MARIRLDCNLHVASYPNWNKSEDLPKESRLELPEGEYEFHYDYPLSTLAIFKHRLNGKATARAILGFAARDYRRIYDIEDKKVGKTGNISGMFNRERSEGPFGIWGHHIDDLFFETLIIDTKKMRVFFDVGS